MKYLGIILSTVVGAAILFVAVGALFSLPVWLLWNGLMPQLFGLTKITWFQAWGLMVLCSFLFKSSSISNKKED